jgi:F0F1-type ATP synthase assembly protein I
MGAQFKTAVIFGSGFIVGVFLGQWLLDRAKAVTTR